MIKGKKVKSGDKFHRIKVIEVKLLDCGKQRKTYAFCICDCGKFVKCIASALVQKKYKSCGCWKNEKASERISKMNEPNKHGLTDHRLYKIWSGMKSRCNNKNQISYKDYGARGIKICKEWNNNFLKFYNWSIKNGYKDNLS